MVGLQIRTLNIFTVLNEYSLYGVDFNLISLQTKKLP